MARSEFPIVDVIKSSLDPFARLFNTVFRWQRNEKKWTDGSFTDLNSEVVEAECEEFWREIYKINKQFTNTIKKRKLELQAKLSEKKKSKSKRCGLKSGDSCSGTLSCLAFLQRRST